MESALERIFERVVNALSMRSGISNLRAQKKEVIDSLIDGLKIEGLNTNGHRTKNPQDVPWNFYGQSTITNPCARGTGVLSHLWLSAHTCIFWTHRCDSTYLYHN